MKKTPFQHLLRPLDYNPTRDDVIDEKAVLRLIQHLYQYHQEMVRMNHSKCKIIDDFLSNPIFFDAVPIRLKLADWEEMFKSFLWRLKIYQKELLSSPLPSLSMGRYLHLFDHKLMTVAVAILRMRKLHSGLDLKTNRMSVGLASLKMTCSCLELLKKSYQEASLKLNQIVLNPRYSSFTKALQTALEDAFLQINSSIKHKQQPFLTYLSEKCERFSEETSDIELYFEGDVLNQELQLMASTSVSQLLAKAFLEAYEQCLSSSSSDGCAQKLKADLADLLPFLIVYSCLHATLKLWPMCLVKDALYPKKDLDPKEMAAKLQQEKNHFMTLPIKYHDTSLSDLSLWTLYLQDRDLERLFSYVLAF